MCQKNAEKMNKDQADHNLIPASLPDWFPVEATRYLIHTENGASIREIARQADCHASTILRQIRQLENRRDDPLVDEALNFWGKNLTKAPNPSEKDFCVMTFPDCHVYPTPKTTDITKEARRVLRRLCETGAILALAKEMDKAAVVRDLPSGGTVRTAVVDREIAQSMAIKRWIICTTKNSETSRILRYQITAAGRSALKKMLAEVENRKAGFSEARVKFSGLNNNTNVTTIGQSLLGHDCLTRYNAGETPLSTLARRKTKEGLPFLDDMLVSAGERLREDFELVHFEPDEPVNWEHFLTMNCSNKNEKPAHSQASLNSALVRVKAALTDLGPGLGDVVLRCCCYLEGIEKAEKSMGWSARSGKIVLRIALQRLKRHYDENYGPHGPMIG